MISLMKIILPVEQNRIICLDSLSSLWQKSHFRGPPAETFPISGTSPPSPHWVGKVADYHQLSASFNNSITNSQSGEKTFENFPNFNFCLTFNFLRVQPGRSRGLGSPINNTERREPKNFYSTVAGASRFRNIVEQQDIYHPPPSF